MTWLRFSMTIMLSIVLHLMRALSNELLNLKTWIAKFPCLGDRPLMLIEIQGEASILMKDGKLWEEYRRLIAPGYHGQFQRFQNRQSR